MLAIDRVSDNVGTVKHSFEHTALAGNGMVRAFESQLMNKIETLLERITAQNETTIEQNEKILLLLSLRALENLPQPEISSKPKNN